MKMKGETGDMSLDESFLEIGKGSVKSTLSIYVYGVESLICANILTVDF